MLAIDGCSSLSKFGWNCKAGLFLLVLLTVMVVGICQTTQARLPYSMRVSKPLPLTVTITCTGQCSLRFGVSLEQSELESESDGKG